MARVICDKDFKETVIDKGYIENYSEDCIDGMKYDFRLGKSFLKAKYGRPMDFSDVKGEAVENLFIQPGEVVFVLSEETLNLPKNIFIQLSEKRKMSHLGIITLGGFSVDPGYKGRLLFGLYNISSRNFPLRVNRKLVGSVFYELDESEIPVSSNPPEAINEFPDELVDIMKEFVPISNDAIAKIQCDISLLIDKNKSNGERLSFYDNCIKEINQALDKETQKREDGLNRESSERKDDHEKISLIDKNLEKLKVNVSAVKWMIMISMPFFIAIFTGLVVAIITGFLHVN